MLGASGVRLLLQLLPSTDRNSDRSAKLGVDEIIVLGMSLAESQNKLSSRSYTVGPVRGRRRGGLTPNEALKALLPLVRLAAGEGLIGEHLSQALYLNTARSWSIYG